MANIDYIKGGYTIDPGPPQTFEFWWPGGGKANEYFDVSIALTGGMDRDGDIVSSRQPLRVTETAREMLRVLDEASQQIRYILRLTIRNEEAFQVSFIANHVRI